MVSKDVKEDSVIEELSAYGERAKGAIKQAVGTVTGDAELEREGESENIEGRARLATNIVYDDSYTVPTAAEATMTSWLSATFDDRKSVEQAYHSIITRGYNREDISLMMSENVRNAHFLGEIAECEAGTKAMEGAGIGSTVGGVTVGIIAALSAIGTNIVLPGFGIVVAGPILLGLAGAGAGGAAGSIIGALIGSGIPEQRARSYEDDIKNGSIVLGVVPHSEADAEYFENEWKSLNARNIHR